MPLDLRTSKIVEQLESTKGAEILNFPFLEFRDLDLEFYNCQDWKALRLIRLQKL